MKEIKPSFKISIALNQTDIHWIEEELLLRIREEIFKKVFNKVLRGVEKEAIKVTRVCKKCKTLLVNNGNEPKKIRTLFLKKFTGLKVSHKKIHEMALEEGKTIEDWEEDRRDKVFEGGQNLEDVDKKSPEVLYIQVDGTGVNDRATKERQEAMVLGL